MSIVVRYLPVTECLERVSLTGSALQVFQAQEVVEALAPSHSLQVLTCAHMQIDTVTLHALIRFLTVNKSLQKFDLRGIHQLDKQLFQLLEALKLNSSLQLLNLEGNVHIFLELVSSHLLIYNIPFRTIVTNNFILEGERFEHNLSYLGHGI